MALLVNGKVTKSGLPHEILTEATLKTFMEQMFQCIMTEIESVSFPKRGNRLEGNSNSNDIE